jgi:hypothetical protein
MRHFASTAFREACAKLPDNVRALADRNSALLKENPQHPSLHFKKLGRYWPVRIGLRY